MQERVSQAAFKSSCRTGRETPRSEVPLRGSCNYYLLAEHSPRLHHLPRKASSNNPEQQRQMQALTASVTENRTPFRYRRLIAFPLQENNITCLVMKSMKEKLNVNMCISFWTLYRDGAMTRFVRLFNLKVLRNCTLPEGSVDRHSQDSL